MILQEWSIFEERDFEEGLGFSSGLTKLDKSLELYFKNIQLLVAKKAINLEGSQAYVHQEH